MATVLHRMVKGTTTVQIEEERGRRLWREYVDGNRVRSETFQAPVFVLIEDLKRMGFKEERVDGRKGDET